MQNKTLCYGCDEVLPDLLFSSSMPDPYPHLALAHVCNRCKYNTRVCTTCKRPYPANRKWFVPRKGGKFGLHSLCKRCFSHRTSARLKRARLERAANRK